MARRRAVPVFGTGQPPDRRGDPKDREEVTHHVLAIDDFRVEVLGTHGEVGGKGADQGAQDVVVVAEVELALPGED
jgi:hypothetical protein